MSDSENKPKFGLGIESLISSLNSIRNKNQSASRHTVTLDRELGKWVVRLNGTFIEEFYRKSSAERLVAKLEEGLKR